MTSVRSWFISYVHRCISNSAWITATFLSLVLSAAAQEVLAGGAPQTCPAGTGAPPACTANCVNANINTLTVTAQEGDKVCFSVDFFNGPSPCCDVASLDASLFIGDPDGPGGTASEEVYVVTTDAYIAINEFITCPGPDPRCAPGNCTIPGQIGYEYTVAPSDEHGETGNSCPPDPADGTGQISAYVQGSGTLCRQIQTGASLCKSLAIRVSPPCSVVIAKTVALDDNCDGTADDPNGFVDSVEQDPSECVVYRVCVTNTGGQTLNANGVLVSDAHLGVVNANFGTIAATNPDTTVCRLIPSQITATDCPGGECICSNVEGENTATITSAICTDTNENACDQTGSDCDDVAEVDCLPCSVVIAKTVALDDNCDGTADDPNGFVDSVEQDPSECVVYRVCVTNTGGQTLNANGVLVSDAHLGVVNANFGTIAATNPDTTVCRLIPSQITATDCPGGECICSNVEGENTATITSAICTDTNENACDQTGSDCDDVAEVDCLPCSVVIAKTVALDDNCDGTADDPNGFVDSVEQDPSECVVYRVCVTNTGGQTLNANGVLVSDAHLGVVNANFGTIAATNPDTTVCRLIPSQITATDCPGGECICSNVEGENTATITSAICTDTNENACAQTGSDCDDIAEVDCISPPGDCMVIIDEEGLDNDFQSLEDMMEGCGFQVDSLINDGEQPSYGIPLDVPTEGIHDPLRWNTLIGNGNTCLEQPVLLPTGQRDDEGYFALPEEIKYALGNNNGNCISPFNGPPCLFDSLNGVCGIRTTTGAFITTSDAWRLAFAEGSLPQYALDKVCYVMPYRNHELLQLIGRTCVAVVYDSDINPDFDKSDDNKFYANLQGERYGLWTFKVLGTPLCECGDFAPNCPPLDLFLPPGQWGQSLGLELAGTLPESTSSTSLYDLWIQALPPQDPGLGCPLFLRDHEPDSISITKAKFNKLTNTVTIHGVSQYRPPAVMTVSIDRFVLEANMTYNIAQRRFEFTATSTQNLRGRRVTISTDKGGVYNRRIE